MYRLLTLRISGGMVALNNQVLSLCGVFFRINSISSWNPMFSISSASSNTTYLICSRLIAFLSIRSINLPGVATTMCTPLFRSRICRPIEAPPYTATTETPVMYFLKSSISFTICRQSSLVGQTTRAWGYRAAASIICNRGKPNAAVFPVPVCARPIKSCVPLSNNGIACSCIAVGFT